VAELEIGKSVIADIFAEEIVTDGLLPELSVAVAMGRVIRANALPRSLPTVMSFGHVMLGAVSSTQ
jgi:hypothetical protein